MVRNWGNIGASLANMLTMLDIAKEIVCGPRIGAGSRSRAYWVRHLTKNYIVKIRLNEVHGWWETLAHH